MSRGRSFQASIIHTKEESHDTATITCFLYQARGTKVRKNFQQL